MANVRALDKRRKAIRNIRKITRTMELIATARFKKAMDRAHAATAYTDRISALVANLANSGLDVSHPLLEGRPEQHRGVVLMLSANRGLCGGYNGNIQRLGFRRYQELGGQLGHLALEISGKRGLSAAKFREIPVDESYTHFEDSPTFDEVEVLANRYLEEYSTGKLDRLDVVYTRFVNIGRQVATTETLLPLGELEGADSDTTAEDNRASDVHYEFLPSPESILEEVVPTSFKVKLFKCFLDAAVSEQIARMVAMKAATENAGDLIRSLTQTYNRARQGQITSDLMDVIGGVEALGG
jgi:F-type H+-transporting ATPase subunit gamma